MRLILLFSLLLLRHFSIVSCSWFSLNNFLRRIKTNEFKDYGTKELNDISQTKAKNSKYVFKNHTLVKELITDLKTEISTEGFVNLHALGFKIKNHFNQTMDISEILRKATWSYNAQLNKYFNLIGNEKVKFDIEKEFYILHAIESTNRIFANESEKLYAHINTLAKKTNCTLNSTNKLLSEEILHSILKEKEVNLRFVCQKLKICKRFPAFSDNLARLLNEIIQLKGAKFETIVRMLKEIGRIKAPSLNTLVDDETAFKIYSKVTALADNLPMIRNLLTALKEILANRYRIFKIANGETKLQTKAARILIDILDAAFEMLQEDLVKIQFENAIKSIKEWPVDNSDDVKAKLVDLCDIIEDVLRFNWSASVNEEVKILSNVIIVASPTNDTFELDDLFTRGSKFVRRESVLLRFDPDISLSEFDE